MFVIWLMTFYFSVVWMLVYCCSGLFPGGRRAEAPRSAMHSPAPGHGPVLRPPTPETARTAPATVSTTLHYFITHIREDLSYYKVKIVSDSSLQEIGIELFYFSISLNNSTMCLK